ncbi:AraC family transcriptional regulator [Solitalea canadensis]|uniref:DNA-binding domain-containing protein, AraC-type n=1 Tax=Solitalea canadensis (strain ATCC 29591 / DSM 3403 / JCM 21819 / LMG 8368 / NBRC 15130 / NCIMB 12057 / USAM 9D) TaxID=929556 RepID=H8KVT4_SOLCM|nr:AraC family transcriptional regulator [Solitalea canadensis]AFD06707.1 DNA-binding domain-containing protein, AraC-type [Solitalea canadensis DSM 3403]
MKPQLLKVSTNLAQSFSARRDSVPYINNRWHYHPEVELIYFKQGNGTQFIGDSIKRFKSGDIVLVGAHMPHYWRFDDTYFVKDSAITADVIVVHFCENFWGDQFLNLPENKVIKYAFERAKRGIQVTGKMQKNVAEILSQILLAEGPKKIMLLIEALANIGSSNDLELLSSIGFKHDFEEPENERINAIYDYSLANYKHKIQLEDVAKIASMSPNSFCRYFKNRTRKTYSLFINEIRVGVACKLLIENKINIKQVCYESGFHNFASFHKYFKLITGKSPLTYQKEFLAKN